MSYLGKPWWHSPALRTGLSRQVPYADYYPTYSGSWQSVFPPILGVPLFFTKPLSQLCATSKIWYIPCILMGFLLSGSPDRFLGLMNKVLTSPASDSQRFICKCDTTDISCPLLSGNLHYKTFNGIYKSSNACRARWMANNTRDMLIHPLSDFNLMWRHLFFNANSLKLWHPHQ